MSQNFLKALSQCCTGSPHTTGTRAGGAREESGKFLRAQSQPRLSMERSHATPSTNTSTKLRLKCFAQPKFHMQTPSVVQYSIDAQIDVFDTQAFTEDQIKDTCEYAHTCNLGRHSRTHFQRDCNFTDRYLFSLSTTLIATPHPLLPSSLKLPSQNHFTAFHVSEFFRL